MWNLIQIYLGLLIYDSLQVYGISLGAVAYKCHCIHFIYLKKYLLNVYR